MHRLMIGIEMDGIQDLEEDAILDFFKQERKLNCDDDYFFLNEENKFEYFIIERSNYAVFKEYYNNDFFTTHVIEFLRTLESNGKIIVQEDDGSGNTDDEDILFTGKISAFLNHWDSIGDGDE